MMSTFPLTNAVIITMKIKERSGAVEPNGPRILDVAHQVKVGVVAEGAAEVRPNLQEQGVTRVQPVVTDLVGKALPVAMHGDNRCIVQ